MDVRLETFLELCKQMNYRATADTLHITQPTVTQHIQSLEQEFNCKLFIYSKKKLSRTSATALLQEYALSVKLNEQMVHRQISNPGRRMLHIGTTCAIKESILDTYLEKIYKASEYDVSVVIKDTQTLLEEILSFQLDCAFVDEPITYSEFDIEPLLTDSFVGVCSKHHPFAGQEINTNQLYNQNVFIPKDGTICRKTFDAILSSERISIERFQKKSFIEDIGSSLYLVQKDCGISFTFASIASRYPELETFSLTNYSMSADYNLVYIKDSSIRPVLSGIL